MEHLLTRRSWLKTGFTNCSDFIGKDEWPPNSPDLNPFDFHIWGAMLECYKIQAKYHRRAEEILANNMG